MGLALVQMTERKLTRSERIEKLIAASSMFVSQAWSDGALKWLHIEIRGKLSAIPGVKNNRYNGRPDQVVLDKVIALERMYRREVYDHVSRINPKPVTFGSAPVFCMLTIGKKGNRSDPDNALTTIKDWLEPREKMVGRLKHIRGWGVGAVDNDSQIAGFAVRCCDVGLPDECTTIDVRPMSEVEEYVLKLIAGARLL